MDNHIRFTQIYGFEELQMEIEKKILSETNQTVNFETKVKFVFWTTICVIYAASNKQHHWVQMFNLEWMSTDKINTVLILIFTHSIGIYPLDTVTNHWTTGPFFYQTACA